MMNNCYADLAAREHQHEEGRKTEWEIEADRRFVDFVADENKVAELIEEHAADLARAFCCNGGADAKLTKLIYGDIERDMRTDCATGDV